MEITEKFPKGSTDSYTSSFISRLQQHKKLYAQSKKLFLNLQQNRLLYTSKASNLLEQTVSIEKISETDH